MPVEIATVLATAVCLTNQISHETFLKGSGMQVQQQFDELPEIILNPEAGAALLELFEQNGSQHVVCLANHPALMERLVSALASQVGILPKEESPLESQLIGKTE
jgi:hypothetical protein